MSNNSALIKCILPPTDTALQPSQPEGLPEDSGVMIVVTSNAVGIRSAL